MRGLRDTSAQHHCPAPPRCCPTIAPSLRCLALLCTFPRADLRRGGCLSRHQRGRWRLLRRGAARTDLVSPHLPGHAHAHLRAERHERNVHQVRAVRQPGSRLCGRVKGSGEVDRHSLGIHHNTRCEMTSLLGRWEAGRGPGSCESCSAGLSRS